MSRPIIIYATNLFVEIGFVLDFCAKPGRERASGCDLHALTHANAFSKVMCETVRA